MCLFTLRVQYSVSVLLFKKKKNIAVLHKSYLLPVESNLFHYLWHYLALPRKSQTLWCYIWPRISINPFKIDPSLKSPQTNSKVSKNKPTNLPPLMLNQVWCCKPVHRSFCYPFKNQASGYGTGTLKCGASLCIGGFLSVAWCLGSFDAVFAEVDGGLQPGFFAHTWTAAFEKAP